MKKNTALWSLIHEWAPDGDPISVDDGQVDWGFRLHKDLCLISPDVPQNAHSILDPEEMLPQEVARLLEPLDDRERQVLTLRYGLDRGDPRTLDEVGVVLDLTRERIRQIEKEAIYKLRRQLLGTDAHALLAS